MTAELSQAVIGFRAWVVQGDRLCALDGEAWPEGDVVARCRNHRGHAAPEAECGCGLYALHESPSAPLGGTVVGAVLAWGDLQVHLDGFRAAHARPIALSRAATLPDDQLERIARRYNVPLVTAPALEAVAREFGGPVPLDQRPADPAHLLGEFTSAIRRRERGWPGEPLLEARDDRRCLDVVARLEDGAELDSALVAGWLTPGRAPRSTGRGMKALRRALTARLREPDGLTEDDVASILHALDHAHGPVRRSVEDLVARGAEDLVPSRYLLHPEIAPSVMVAARGRARARIQLGSGDLLPMSGDGAVLLLEPDLDDADLERLVPKMRSAFQIARLLDQSRLRRPALARTVLRSANSLVARAAAKQLGRSARPTLLRQLRDNPWLFSYHRDPQLHALVGEAALRLAAERQLRLASDAVDVVGALGLLPGAEAQPGLERLLTGIEGTRTPAEGHLRLRAWNGICSREHLAALIPPARVRAALADDTLGTTNHALLLRANPEADPHAARRIWTTRPILARFALDVLRAAGPASVDLADQALSTWERARTDNAATSRLAAALVVLADQPRFAVAAKPIAADRNQPATVRAVASFLLGTSSGSDPAARRYRRWCQLHRPQSANPIRDLLSGVWQEQTLL